MAAAQPSTGACRSLHCTTRRAAPLTPASSLRAFFLFRHLARLTALQSALRLLDLSCFVCASTGAAQACVP